MCEAPERSSDPAGGTTERVSARAGTRKSGSGTGVGWYAAAGRSGSYARYDRAELAANSAAEQMSAPELNTGRREDWPPASHTLRLPCRHGGTGLRQRVRVRRFRLD